MSAAILPSRKVYQLSLVLLKLKSKQIKLVGPVSPQSKQLILFFMQNTEDSSPTIGQK